MATQKTEVVINLFLEDAEEARACVLKVKIRDSEHTQFIPAPPTQGELNAATQKAMRNLLDRGIELCSLDKFRSKHDHSRPDDDALKPPKADKPKDEGASKPEDKPKADDKPKPKPPVKPPQPKPAPAEPAPTAPVETKPEVPEAGSLKYKGKK